MSPEQIEAVRRMWSAALRDPTALVASMATALITDPATDPATGPATEDAAVGRARWAVDSITRLVLVLDRPTAFTAVAEAEIARLPRITLAELTDVQDAGLAALHDLLGALTCAEERAWRGACALFTELVAAQHLAPFAPPTAPPPRPPPASASSVAPAHPSAVPTPAPTPRPHHPARAAGPPAGRPAPHQETHP